MSGNTYDASSLPPLVEAFQADPANGRAQALLGEHLLFSGDLNAALQVLDRPHQLDPEEPAFYDWKLNLLSMTLERAGQTDRAALLNRELITYGYGKGWAFAAEAARLAMGGEHQLAARYFHAAGHAGLVNGRVAYRIAWMLRPHDFEADFFYLYYPQWRERHELIGPAMSEGFARNTLEGARLRQPDFLFGAGGDLSIEQETLITGVLDRHEAAFEAGETPPPRCLADFAAPVAEEDAPPFERVLFLGPTTYVRHGKPKESEVARAYLTGFIDAGIQCEMFDSAALVQQTEAAVIGLEKQIAELKPDLVFIDAAKRADFLKALGPQRLAQWRSRYGFRIVTFLSDPHEHLDLTIDLWAGVSDLLLTVPFDGVFLRPHMDRNKVLHAALNPLSDDHMDRAAAIEKDLEFFFIGEAGSTRNAFVETLTPLYERSFVQVNNREPLPDPVDNETYYATLLRSRITINAGYMDEFESPRGRTTEAVASGVLALEYGGELASWLYTPFIHFIPVMNLVQAEAFARYFLKHPARRDRIADRALAHYRRYYASRPLWHAVRRRLDLLSGAA